MDEDTKLILEVVQALYDCVKSAGESGLPSGHLYAHVMGKMTLAQYETLMGLLVKSGRIRMNHHCYFVIE